MTAPGVAALLRAEAEKVARQPTTWVLVGILAAFVGLVLVVFTSILGASGAEGMGREVFLVPLRIDAVGFMLSVFSGNATILLVVFAASLVAQEFSRGTLRTLLLTGARRRDVAVAKLATVLGAALVLALVGALAAVLSAVTFGAVAGEDLLNVDAGSFAWRLVALVASFATWGVLAATLALWTRSLGAGIGSVLALLFVGDLFGGILARAGDAGVYASRILPNAALSTLGRGAPPPLETWAWAAPVLLAYAVALPAFAIRRFERLDALGATK